MLSSDLDMVKGVVKETEKEKSSRIVRKVVGKSLFPQHGHRLKGKVSAWTPNGFPQTSRPKLNMELVSCLHFGCFPVFLSMFFEVHVHTLM